MKLATYKDGSRDGQLVVVSRDLTSAHFATGIATRLQQVLDDWNFLSPQLEDLSAQLNGGKSRHAFPFDPRLCLAPLPRLGLFAQAAGGGPAGAPDLIIRAGGPVRGPVADAVFPAGAAGIACEVSIAVVTGDVAPGVDSGPALESVRLLLMLADGRFDLEAGAAGQWIAPAFAPVAVTPDELGGAWQRGKASLAVSVQRNGRAWARLAAGSGQRLHFGQLIARLAATGPLGAGSVVASGPLAAAEGSPAPTALHAGDTLRIEARGEDGPSAFGPIEQALRWQGPAEADPPPGSGDAPAQPAAAPAASGTATSEPGAEGDRADGAPAA